jgi:hypothetical protein
MDLEKLYVGQKAHEKMGLEFVEEKPPPISKNTGSSKEKEKHSLKLENKKYKKYKR